MRDHLRRGRAAEHDASALTVGNLDVLEWASLPTRPHGSWLHYPVNLFFEKLMARGANNKL